MHLYFGRLALQTPHKGLLDLGVAVSSSSVVKELLPSTVGVCEARLPSAGCGAGVAPSSMVVVGLLVAMGLSI